MGLIISIFLIIMWLSHLIYSLKFVSIYPLNPFLYIHILIQAYLYTGLFITGHDAMHGTISSNKSINHKIGVFAVFLFAAMSFKKLLKNHSMHHKYPGTSNDPDFSSTSQNFWKWWLVFLKRYTTVQQIVLMAVFYNILMIWFNELSIWLVWILPAFLSTLQLFYIGTYLPHKYPHNDEMQPHNARTQNKNHLWAMLSCYFFGYHHEHHEHPRIPWWQLYKLK